VKRAEEKYRDEGLKVIWMTHQDKIPKLRAYARRHKITGSIAYDKNDSVSAKYGMTYGGGVVFVDRTGMARKRIPKGFTVGQLEDAISVIIKPAPSRAD